MQAYIVLQFRAAVAVTTGDSFQYRILVDGVPLFAGALEYTLINIENAANPPNDVATGADLDETIGNILINLQTQWAHAGITYIRVGLFILVSVNIAETITVDNILDVDTPLPDPDALEIYFNQETVIVGEKPVLTLTFNNILPEHYYFRFDVTNYGFIQFITTFVTTMTGDDQTEIGADVNECAQNFMHSLMVNYPQLLDEFVFSVSDNVVTITAVSDDPAFTEFYHYDSYPLTPADIPLINHIADNYPDFVTTSISENGLNFTGDNQPVILNKFIPQNVPEPEDAMHHIEFFMDIEVFDYQGGSKIVNYSVKVPFNGNTARFFPAKVIEGVMEKLNSFSDVLAPAIANDAGQVNTSYTPARASVFVRQIRTGYGWIRTERELPDFDFLKGITPPVYTLGDGVLSVSDIPVRTTPKSYVLFNFCKSAGAHDITVLRNTEAYETINHNPGTDSNFLLLYEFSAFKEGDVIEIQIAREGNTFSRKYVVFPVGMHSVHIGWEDEYGNPQLYEFTGDWKVDSVYNRISHEYYRNFVQVLENLSIDKQQKIICNTGFILKSNHAIIDSILRANKAWFVFPDQDKRFEIIPLSESLNNYDTDRDLYDYTLEFNINRYDDYKVYPY